jgi:hypothetical protein
MRRISLAVMLVLIGAGNALACSCVGQSDAKYRRAADVIFAGTVTSSADPNPGPIISSADPITYTFAVERSAKGVVGATQEVVSARNGASCGCSFATGGRYVVYATLARGVPWANLCGGSRDLAANEPPFALWRVATFGTYAGRVARVIGTVRRGEHPGLAAFRILLADGFSGTGGGSATASPRGTRLLRYHANDGTVRITLSRRFARLAGAPLRLALAQIVFTASDLPGVRRVHVRTALGPLPGFDRPLTVADFRRESSPRRLPPG